MKSTARDGRLRRHGRVRQRVQGTAQRPRLCVFRSLNHIYVQLIDDTVGRTLATASSLEAALRSQERQAKRVDMARRVGTLVAERARELGVKQVVFDRGGYQFHGRVRAVAEAAREAGLEF